MYSYARVRSIFAKAGVGFGIGPIVKITLLFEPRYDGVDDGFAAVAGLDAGLHQAPELGFRAHCAAQGADGIAVEADLVEDWTRPGGFAREGQRIPPGCGFSFKSGPAKRQATQSRLACHFCGAM